MGKLSELQLTLLEIGMRSLLVRVVESITQDTPVYNVCTGHRGGLQDMVILFGSSRADLAL